jgi:endonuclease/exonuclease/phosphatase family metal-dependent hydrolase
MNLHRAGPTLFCLFCALVVAGNVPGPSRQADPAGGLTSEAPPIRVMSFNLRYGTADDADNAWPHRRDLVMRTIREFDPILLDVQEALRFQLDELHAEFPHLAEIGVGRDDGAEAGEYSAILYDQNRLERLDAGTFWLSDTPDVVASTSWGNRITRIVTWARFRDRAGGDDDGGSDGATFYVFNTHWDHESQPSRERSAELILRRIADRAGGGPVILTGDFNAGEDNPAFGRLIAADAGAPDHLRDTFRALHPDAEDVGTFNGFTGERSGEKIDAILVSEEWRVQEAGIDRAHDGERYPSDHFPVTAVVALGTEPAP